MLNNAALGEKRIQKRPLVTIKDDAFAAIRAIVTVCGEFALGFSSFIAVITMTGFGTNIIPESRCFFLRSIWRAFGFGTRRG